MQNYPKVVGLWNIRRNVLLGSEVGGQLRRDDNGWERGKLGIEWSERGGKGLRQPRELGDPKLLNYLQSWGRKILFQGKRTKARN